ncbi:MAG: ABC transporter ATP-binding protein [Phycisphaerales bacterium]|nr:ABC transporter ATP-binding protein [Phycisphaerales bacterium]
MTTPISIQRLTKRFGATTAVGGVSVEVRKGQMFFLLGPSGCGKTTLLRMIAGFTTPDEGTIRFGERDVTRLAPEKRGAGMVFQSYALWPHMSVFQNVEFGLRARKVEKSERRRRAMEALALVRMEPLAERKPGQLSGGQQQRVALARALASGPEALLLDEPLSNLDAKLRHEMRDEIRRVCTATGVTSIYVTHDQKEALSMADAVAVMSEGRIVQIGGPRDVYERPVNRFVAEFMGPTNFLSGRVVESRAGAILLDTPAGRLEARPGAGAPAPAVGQTVTALIRPESFVRSESREGPNVVRGRRVETVYLGEIAQHTVEVAPGVLLKRYEMNPRRERGADAEVALRVDPDDVVAME